MTLRMYVELVADIEKVLVSKIDQGLKLRTIQMLIKQAQDRDWFDD